MLGRGISIVASVIIVALLPYDALAAGCPFLIVPAIRGRAGTASAA
jgi:hypothetical protein